MRTSSYLHKGKSLQCTSNICSGVLPPLSENFSAHGKEGVVVIDMLQQICVLDLNLDKER